MVVSRGTLCNVQLLGLADVFLEMTVGWLHSDVLSSFTQSLT